jgi:hypothetical protein
MVPLVWQLLLVLGKLRHSVHERVFERWFSGPLGKQLAPRIPPHFVMAQKGLLIQNRVVLLLFECHALHEVIDNVLITKSKELVEQVHAQKEVHRVGIIHPAIRLSVFFKKYANARLKSIMP